MRGGELGELEGGSDVDPHGLLELLVRHRRKVRRVHDPGVVHHGVQACIARIAFCFDCVFRENSGSCPISDSDREIEWGKK